jgi:hypothetical protein
MQRLTTCVIAAGAVGWLFATAPARADEAKSAIHAISILNTMARPIVTRESAFDASLREAQRPPTGPVAEVVGEGTVRYGRTTVTVKNPCPPGEHYEPPPLPGRRRR